MLKHILILIAGSVLGVAVTMGGGFLYMQSEVDERIYEATSKLAKSKKKSSSKRWIALGDVAIWSIDDGLLANAKKNAEELLATSLKHRDDWNYGNAIHKAHIALGRLALKQNDIPSAIEQLRMAGETPGSPQLNTFGPKMILALELLRLGETAPVLEYFTLCEKFWEPGSERLSNWRETVESGEIPHFGSSL